MYQHAYEKLASYSKGLLIPTSPIRTFDIQSVATEVFDTISVEYARVYESATKDLFVTVQALAPAWPSPEVFNFVHPWPTFFTLYGWLSPLIWTKPIWFLASMLPSHQGLNQSSTKKRQWDLFCWAIDPFHTHVRPFPCPNFFGTTVDVTYVPWTEQPSMTRALVGSGTHDYFDNTLADIHYDVSTLMFASCTICRVSTSLWVM